jgi:hypothetical protein
MALWSTPPSYSFSRIPALAVTAGVTSKATLNSAAATIFTYANSVGHDLGRNLAAFFERHSSALRREVVMGPQLGYASRKRTRRPRRLAAPPPCSGGGRAK